MKLLSIYALLAFSAHAQMVMPNQGGTGTRPATTLPATCSTGRIFFKTNATAGQNIYLCTAANTWTLLSSSSITGLTTSALVTAASATGIQTPSATATMDSSGNIATPGTIQSGVGGSGAGGIDMVQGAALSPPANSVTRHAPASIPTGFTIVEPSAAGTGCFYGTNTAGVVATTFNSACGGSPIATSGRGYQIIPIENFALVNGQDSFASTKTNPVYWQFVAKNITASSIVVDVSSSNASAAHGSVLGIMDTSCNLVANTTGQILNGATGKITYVFASPPTLTPGAVYYYGFAAENTTMLLFQHQTSGIFAILLNEGASKYRTFTGATAATGTGTSLVLPASCGAQTAGTQYPIFAALIP